MLEVHSIIVKETERPISLDPTGKKVMLPEPGAEESMAIQNLIQVGSGKYIAGIIIEKALAKKKFKIPGSAFRRRKLITRNNIGDIMTQAPRNLSATNLKILRKYPVLRDLSVKEIVL